MGNKLFRPVPKPDKNVGKEPVPKPDKSAKEEENGRKGKKSLQCGHWCGILNCISMRRAPPHYERNQAMRNVVEYLEATARRLRVNGSRVDPTSLFSGLV